MIHSQMSKLLKLDNITDVKDVSRLRKFFDTIDIQVWSLKSLCYEPDSYKLSLIPIITSKIPDDLNLIISSKFDYLYSWKVKICEMNILDSLLLALLYSAIRKNPQFYVSFVKSHTKTRIVVLSLTYRQEKMLCEQVNVVLYV